MKFYIATKLENDAAHNRLRNTLQAEGHEITYDWTHHGSVQTAGIERIREVAFLETQGVLEADFVVILWPGGRGTHVELGLAIAAGKSVFFVTPHEDHHHSTPETCAFYHHDLVKLSYTEAEALQQIRDVVNYTVKGLNATVYPNIKVTNKVIPSTTL